MKLEKNDIILFDGDSITDCGRDITDFNSLAGYSKIIDDTLKLYKSQLNITSINRGVSGDTSTLLLERLENEFITLKPTVFSLLIGINDTWRRYDSNLAISTENFDKNINAILELAKKYVKKIILIEPFLLYVDKDKESYREDLDPKIAALRRNAIKFNTDFVPMNGIFAENSITINPIDLSLDSVHPTMLGHSIIAKEWLARITF